MPPLSEKRSKWLISALAAVQFACVLLAGFFGGHAMLFCQPKETGPDACRRTPEYIWNHDMSSHFVRIWLAAFAASLFLAFLCPRRHRNIVVGVLLISLPLAGYFVFLFMLMAGA